MLKELQVKTILINAKWKIGKLLLEETYYKKEFITSSMGPSNPSQPRIVNLVCSTDMSSIIHETLYVASLEVITTPLGGI